MIMLLQKFSIYATLFCFEFAIDGQVKDKLLTVGLFILSKLSYFFFSDLFVFLNIKLKKKNVSSVAFQYSQQMW